MNNCPVCHSPATFIEAVPATLITSGILQALPDLDPSYQAPLDYSLACCNNCDLVFADPMSSGDDDFYGWICSSRFYYPQARWEWTPLIQIIRLQGYQRILDVGCGSGLFLEVLRQHGIRGLGVDANPQSVEICTQRGLNASCVGIEELDESIVGRYEAITLFHVLEHLVDPVGALFRLRKLLVPGGVIALSVPYSPMSFETDWRDPLNRPPHHLTRWNDRSLRALANAAGLEPQFFVQPSRGLVSRTLSTLQVMHGLAPVACRTAVMRTVQNGLRLARRPMDSMRIFVHQQQRDRLNGSPKGDAVLVILSEVAA